MWSRVRFPHPALAWCSERFLDDSQAEHGTHPVIDRAPTVVTDPGPEPVDERVFNPIGFRKDWDHPVVDLSRIGRGPVTEGLGYAEQGIDDQPGLPELLALVDAELGNDWR